MSWPTAPLGELTTKIGSGATPRGGSKAYKPEGTPIIRSMNVHDGRFEANGLAFIDEAQAAALNNVVLKPGDVLLNITGASVARCCRLPDGMAGGRVNQHVAIVRPDTELLAGDYLQHLLVAPDTKAKLLGIAGGGATREAITKSAIESFEIPLPPLEEQKRIAGILDQAAELCRLRTRALDKLGTLGQAIFHEMFVGDTSDSWPRVQVEHFAENMRTGPFGSQLLHSEFVDHGIPVLGIDNAVSNEFRWAKERFITVEKYEQLKRFTVLPGDVLITIMGTCGRCAVVPEDIPTAINTKHLCCITVDRAQVLPEFLQAAFLHHPEVLRQLGIEAKGAVMPGMNMGIIKALKLPLPPLSLQGDFGERLKEITVSQAKARTAQKSTESLFAALQHRAFRGEL
ncbi:MULTISPECIES: restriction endonuclease subunit S [unclassified Mameliella]|uniref:restriction endonuclease subunit S n=1 Tax=unclassified Mameliella TaxID=2630630 RepID=UPI00273D0286|nr:MULTISPECIES: restriction endonuclease subunit S [unclassified Mameliella]